MSPTIQEIFGPLDLGDGRREARLTQLVEQMAAQPGVERRVPTPLRPLAVGVVWVRELDPPAGVKPLDWLLLTSLPTVTPAQVVAVVEAYRLRWLIERHHFVLKSGCRIEARRLKTAKWLERALALYGAVAWWLLWVTYPARAPTRMRPARPCWTTRPGGCCTWCASPACRCPAPHRTCTRPCARSACSAASWAGPVMASQGCRPSGVG